MTFAVLLVDAQVEADCPHRAGQAVVPLRARTWEVVAVRWVVS